MSIYVVQPGDSVDSIASLNGVDAASIIYINQLVYPYSLAVGQALLLSPQRVGDRKIFSNGYAYPFISEWVLGQTLPYLSAVSVFSYGFTMEGNLVYPNVSDEMILRMAKEQGVLQILTLTPLDERGAFNNNLISSIVNNPSYQENLITQVINLCIEKGYGGVDVDFEYVKAEDRDGFTAFVAALSDRVHEIGGVISIALAPKVSAEQKGLLYEGKDYGALGAVVDRALLMTYEWGYKYGPNMAVAPIHMVERVVEYAVTEIPPEKLNLGIPNYGYDWPLPFETGKTAAVTIGNVEAVQIAIQQGAEIFFDERAQSPYFRYESQGVEHEVWFEDVRSIQAKFDLIQKYNLAGMGYWQLMRWWRANWILLQENFTIELF